MVLINEIAGNLGKYQIWLCVIICFSKFGVALHQMAIVFLAPPIHYTCPNDMECCGNPVYNRTEFTNTIVMQWDLICKKDWLKDFNQTLFQFGMLVGSLGFGILSDSYGRRPTLMVCLILGFVFGLITPFLPEYWSFSMFRMILGMAMGGHIVIGYVIVMEYVGNTYRDTISALFHGPYIMGHMSLAAYGYFLRDYVFFQMALGLTYILMSLCVFLLPESPRWYLAVNKTEKAIALLERVAKVNGLPTENIKTKIEMYQEEHKLRRQQKGTLLDLFKHPNLRRNILIMSFSWFTCTYCFYGISHYVSHLTEPIYWNVALSGFVGICAIGISMPLMKFLKRKTVIVSCNFVCSICLFIQAALPAGTASTTLSLLGLLFCYIVLIVAYLYCSEMFPTVVRNASFGLTSVMARVGSMLAPFIVSLKVYGLWAAPVAFGIFPLICGFLCLLLPETKDCELQMTIEEGEAFGAISNATAKSNATASSNVTAKSNASAKSNATQGGVT